MKDLAKDREQSPPAWQQVAEGEDRLTPPQDERVSRRWFLERMAWTSSAALAGTLFQPRPGPAQPLPSGQDLTLPETVGAEAPEDLTELTLAEAVSLIHRGTIAPEDLVHAYVDRIEAFDEVYQAYADRPTREQLLERAAGIPAQSRTAVLRGVGVAPKDNLYTHDLLTEAGSLVYEGFRPSYDATAIRQVRDAGGLVLGKGQSGNLAGGRARRYGTTIPTTRNAWTPDQVDYSPGGSSSGPATAVAARLATVGIGTQTGGSVIGPGLAQGLTCLKPTFGRISLHGIVPLSHTRDHVGVMARDALDASLLLQVLAGPDPNDARTLGLPAPPDYPAAARPFGGERPRLRWPTRIGVWPGYLDTESGRVNELRRELVEELESLGAEIVPDVTLPDQWEELTSDPLGGSHGDPTAFFIDELRRDVRNFADRLPRFLNGMLQSADTYVKVHQARGLLLHRMLTQLFTQCDVVLITSSGGAGFDGTGLPLLCLPIGFDEEAGTGASVPRGAVMAAPPFGEERLLSVAAGYQAVTRHHRVRPPDPS